MSSYQFPWWMPGIVWPVVKAPINSTHVHQALSRKESRIGYQQYPQFNFTLGLSFSRDDVVRQQLMASTEDFTQTTVWNSSANVLVIGLPYTLGNASPFGSLEADFVLEDPVNGQHYVGQQRSLTAGTTYTFSCYVKPAGRTSFNLQIFASADWVSNLYDVVAGSVTVATSGTATNGSGSITAGIGAGWYRLSATFTCGTTITHTCVMAMTNGGSTNYVGDGQSGMYVWGAQLEAGTLTGYMPNPTLSAPVTFSDRWAIYGLYNAVQGQFDTFLYEDPTFNSAFGQTFATGNGTATQFQLQAQDAFGIALPPGASPSIYEIVQNLNGLPVVYSNPNTGVGASQLLTYSRNQYVEQSQALATSPWSATAMLSVTNNADVAPDGTTTATVMVPNTTNTPHYNSQFSIAGLTSGTVYMLSGYFKGDGYNFVRIGVADNAFANAGVVNFNLTTGAPGSVSLNIGTFLVFPYMTSVQAVGNGFYRCALAVWCLTNTPNRIIIYVENTDGNINYAGDGTSGVRAWGVQLEKLVTAGGTTAGAGPIAPTTYVPSTTSQVALGADISIANGLVTFATAPVSGATLSWNGCFFYRCRFTTDTLEFSQMYKNWWEMKKIEFTSVKL